MEFVKKFTPSDFQAKNFTPLISPNFNSFSDKNTKKWVKMEKFTAAGTDGIDKFQLCFLGPKTLYFAFFMHF